MSEWETGQTFCKNGKEVAEVVAKSHGKGQSHYRILWRTKRLWLVDQCPNNKKLTQAAKSSI